MKENKRDHLRIRVAHSWKKELKAIALRSGRTETDIVTVAVTTYINDYWAELVIK